MSDKYQVLLIWQSDLVKESREVRKFFKDLNKKTAKKQWKVTFDLVDLCIDGDTGPPRGATPEELLAADNAALAATVILDATGAASTSDEQQQRAVDLLRQADSVAEPFHDTCWFIRALDTSADVAGQLAQTAAGSLQLPVRFAAQAPAACVGFADAEDFKDTLRDELTARLSDEAKPWMGGAAGQKAASLLEASRRDKLAQIDALGIDPWGGRFDGHTSVREIRAREDELQETDHGLRGPNVRAAGRIMLQRSAGKLLFVDIADRTGKIQLLVGKKQVGEENWQLASLLDLGDFIGIDGQLGKTKTGELTIFAEKLHFLSKSLEPPPEKHHGINDPELRQRMRYLDLAYNEGVQERFIKRTRIVQSIRETLNGQGYLEIEGPTLHAIAGGAAARPFITHHNTLDMQLFLRIALELHLKRLLVGGMERVYELGRVYRNEGISPRHNPEFTMLEVYQAYGDYKTMMDLTEQLIVGALAATGGGPKVPWGEDEIDFTPPFARRTYADLFREHTGVDPGDHAAVEKLSREIGFEPSNKHPDVVKNEVFEEYVEDKLKGPIFVLDYPASICPLTKRKADQPEIAERFELFIEGMEVANAYTELNDPDLQEQLFKTQLAGLPEEDSMAKMDHDFIRALRHGMPPAGGLGVGIDRLVMLLTNSQTIRDVILFPLLREAGG